MALTTAQLNAHIRTIITDELVNIGLSDRQVLTFFIRACIRHIRLGGADNIEAGQTSAQFVAQQVLGRSLTAADLHVLKNHWTAEVEPDGSAIGLL